jgi:hypothetical protein
MTLRRWNCILNEKQSLKETARAVEGPIENTIQVTPKNLCTVGRKCTDKQGVDMGKLDMSSYGVIMLSKRIRKYHYLLIYHIFLRAHACTQKHVRAQGCVSVRHCEMSIPFLKNGRVAAKFRRFLVSYKATFLSVLSVYLTRRIIQHSVCFRFACMLANCRGILVSKVFSEKHDRSDIFK